MFQRSAPRDLDPACRNDECARRDFASRDDAIAPRIGFELAEPPQPTDLRLLDHGTADRVGLR
jgi:hypothetical protein